MFVRSRNILLIAGLLTIGAAYAHVKEEAPPAAATFTAASSRESIASPANAVRAGAIPLVSIPTDSVTPSPAQPHRERHRVPLDTVALSAAFGSTRRSTRRRSGSKRDVPLFLDSDAHVMRENEKTGKPETYVVKGGVMVDDTDLSDDEIDELTAHRAVRRATPDEIARFDQRDSETERASLTESQASELEELRASQASERATVAAEETTTPAKLSALDDKHATAVSKLQAKHAAALAKFDGA
jgi:hypothetical protein